MKVAAAAVEARKRNLGVVIAVVDDSGELICLQRLDDTQVGSITVGIGKARIAAHFRRPTKEFEDHVKGAGWPCPAPRPRPLPRADHSGYCESGDTRIS